MTQTELWISTDLNYNVNVHNVRGNFFCQDHNGNIVGAYVFKGGTAVELEGTVFGYIIRSDGATVIVQGTVDGNRAFIAIPSQALAFPGRINVVIQLVNNEIKTVLAACSGTVLQTRTDQAVDPGEIIPDLSELLAKIADCEAATTAANTAAGEISDMTVDAQTLAEGSPASATISEVSGHKHILFGIPKGEQGVQGEPGVDGKDGTDGTDGKDGVDGRDGSDGKDGTDGQDGVSPIVTVTDITGGHQVTITDATGSHTFNVMNGQQGEPGDPTELIDDTSTASNRAWSAQKTSGKVSELKSALTHKQDILRITSLTQTPVVSGQVIDSVGIPVYVDDITDYPAYGISNTGWYSFVRITAKEGVAVSAQTTVTGADGYIATIGADHVDVAVRFGVAAQSKTVTIAWGSNYTESFVFRATDLAVRNLDYRSTFYIYDIADFAEWTWALTADDTFQNGVNYYTESGGEYTLATVTVGDAIPADTYYVHSKLTFSGMIRNVTYRFNEIVDCPIEIVLPEVPNDGYGAWFEIQMQYSKSVSITLTPTDNTVVIGTATTQAQTAGINVVDLQYSDVNGIKMWTLLNTHSNLPAAGGS